MASLGAPNHPERAEHQEGIGERRIVEAAEIAEIRADPQQLGSRRFSPTDDEHLVRKLYRGDGKSASSETQGMTAGSAAEVDEGARSAEAGVEGLGVCLEEGVSREEGVFLFGQPARVSVRARARH